MVRSFPLQSQRVALRKQRLEARLAEYHRGGYLQHLARSDTLQPSIWDGYVEEMSFFEFVMVGR